MSYTKPGVEVSQVVKTSTPVLTASDLNPVIIGKGYKWISPDVLNNSAYFETQYNPSSSLAVSLGTFIGTSHSNIVANCLVIDLQSVADGSIKHLTAADYSYNASTGVITLNAYLTSGPANVILGTLYAVSGLWNNYTLLESASDIEDLIGPAVSFNPLSFGANLAMLNSGSSVGVVGINVDDSNAHAAVQDVLELQEVYSVVPLTQTNGALYAGHVTTQSQPANKKERILWINSTVDYSSGNKSTIATAVQSASTTLGNFRVFNTHPDVVYIRETRHLATLKTTFMQAVFGAGFTHNALFVNDITISGTKYKAGTELTQTVLTYMLANPDIYGSFFEVLAPAPGFYYSCVEAGRVAAKTPEQPLTNSGGVGLTRVYKSNTYFTETHLNTMAAGGTYIFVQDNPSSGIYVRHQLSTDNSSVIARELSITTTRDYVAKLLRNSCKPYIGRFNITDSFLSLLNTVLVGASMFLKRNGYVKDLKIKSVTQDTINPDTVLIEVELLPYYPANYIKILIVI